MDHAARVAFVQSQCVCAQAKLAAMLAQNDLDRFFNRPMTYQPHDIEAVPDEFGLGHNTVVSYLMEG